MLLLGGVGVPDIQGAHRGELRHRLPVRLHRLHRHRFRIGLAEAVVAGGDGETGRHPFQVVLERTRQGFVEIVQPEQQLPLRRRETAEVRQVRIPAQLHLQTGRRGAGQVDRHHLRRPPVERERRHHHPAMPHRHQIRLPHRVLLDQQLHRIPAASRRRTLRLCRQRRLLRRLLTTRPPIIDAQVRLVSVSGHQSSIRVGWSGLAQSGPRSSRSLRHSLARPTLSNTADTMLTGPHVGEPVNIHDLPTPSGGCRHAERVKIASTRVVRVSRSPAPSTCHGRRDRAVIG